ncbi:MAG: hypothetical protein LIO46_02330 [Clostridiales bacterium]|nr:hypothetical protein [Clostridiales bacterium]
MGKTPNYELITEALADSDSIIVSMENQFGENDGSNISRIDSIMKTLETKQESDREALDETIAALSEIHIGETEPAWKNGDWWYQVVNN